MFAVVFSDHRKWGQRSFLDYLEENGVQYMFDGKELTFETKEAENRARSIWHCLTGQQTIGVVA